MSAHKEPKILFFVTEDWYFLSHRLPLAGAAREFFREVVVVTRVTSHGNQIHGAGLKLVPIRMRRRSMVPWRELSTLWQLWRIYRSECPDLVHHVAIKPVVYGSIAARLAGVPVVVNALTGLGYTYTPIAKRSTALARLMSILLGSVLRMPNSHSIVQNPDDRGFLESLHVNPDCISEIRGSGVDVSRFSPSPEPPGQVVVALVSRLLWDKGVGEFVAAARIARDIGSSIQFVLVGAPDPENPASIPEAKLRAWTAEGIVEWQGPSEEVASVWARSHIGVLPSYREGLPKSLLEAAASGRPVIATNVPGCREVVRDGETGMLVPARDPQALADAILRLAADGSLRARMGQAGRALVEREFSMVAVISQTLDLYRRLLGDRWPA